MFEKFAALRAAYPEDIAQIEAEEKRVSELLQLKAYVEQEGTKVLIRMCRTQIVEARKKLAANRRLTEEERRELWSLIDARMWFLDMVAKDYESELAMIEQQLDADLSVI